MQIILNVPFICIIIFKITIILFIILVRLMIKSIIIYKSNLDLTYKD